MFKRKASSKSTDNKNRHRIKDIRKRPRPSTAAPAAPAAPGFSSGFTAPSEQSTGFSFGQSQSFPPSQPAQSDPTPFSFGGGSQPSFNFTGSSFGSNDSAPSTNPFASSSFGATITASSQPAQSTGFSFGGAGAGTAQSTPQQTSFSSGIFGSQQNQTSTTAPNLFGASAAANSGANAVTDSMQMSPDSKPKNSALNQTSFQSRNIFGNSDSSTTTNVFTSKPAATPAVSTPSQTFGTSLPPTTTSSLTPASSTIFPSAGSWKQDTTAPQAVAQSVATPTPAKPFGSLFQSTPSASAPSEPEKKDPSTLGAAPGFSFTPVTSKPAEAKEANTGFSFTSATSKPAEAKEANTGFSFTSATSKPAEAKEVNNGFSFTAGTSKSAEPKEVNAAQDLNQPSPSLSSLFGSTPAASPNPFSPKPAEQSSTSNIFAPKPTEATSSNQASLTSAPEKTPTPTSLFGVSTSQPASSSIFGSSSAQGSQSNLFGQSPVTNGSTATPPKAFGNISSPKPAAEQNNTANIFAPKPASAETPAASAPSSFNMFGQKPAVDQGFAKKEPFGNMPPSTSTSPAPGNVSLSEKAAEPTPLTYDGGRPLNPFSTLNPNGPGAPTANPHNWTPKPGTYKAPVVNGKPYGDIPMPNFSDLSPELQDECELMWKIRTLDQSFKAQIAALEPGEHLFDNTIIFYMRVRWSLGCPVQKRPEHMPPATHLYTHPEIPAPPKKQNGPATTESGTVSQTETQKTTSEGPVHANATELRPPAFGASAAAPKFAAPTTAPAFTAPAAPAVPKFGSGAGGDFMAQFAKKAAESAAAEKAKRKAEDFDSDEDDEAEWERRDAEEQEKKRAKIGAVSGMKSVFVEGKGFQFVDENESKLAPAPSTSTEKSPAVIQSPAPSSAPSPAASIFESTSRPLANSENIFGRLTATPQPADDSKDSDASDDEAKPTLSKRRASEETSEDTEASKRSKTNDLFARIQSPAPGQDSASATPKVNPFGSINTSTSNSFGNNSLFAATPTAPTPSMITTTSSSPAPTPSVFSSTPAPVSSPFGGSTFGASKPAATSSLFGASTTQAPKPSIFGASTTPAPKSTLFGASTTTAPADNTWKPNSPIKFSSSETSENKTTESKTSENSSTESKPTESTEEELGAGAFFNLAESAGGEKGEDSVFQCRARAFKLAKGKGWESQGTGFANLFVNESGRARIVLRADPSGSIILNALLKKEIEYKFTNKNSVQFFVPQAGGEPEQWAIRVKVDIAQSFHEKVEAIKN
ncbi:hypothetical protein N7493_002381 [Penicillium malachiteum]|uniref:RanBD1 domain-containing protein n=1 Tax=Penicillium malachiteum TaxID=1324776 RepID=A0AAD6HS40_9EURO|nr:hypothetical protein N7493_002381 [Penicillium malachiteum]